MLGDVLIAVGKRNIKPERDREVGANGQTSIVRPFEDQRQSSPYTCQ